MASSDVEDYEYAYSSGEEDFDDASCGTEDKEAEDMHWEERQVNPNAAPMGSYTRCE